MGAAWSVVVSGVIAVPVPRFGMIDHCNGPCAFTVANALFSQGVGLQDLADLIQGYAILVIF